MNNEKIDFGIIRRYFDGKGYGFITPENGGDDIFFHHTQIQFEDENQKTIKEGEKVSFILIQGPKGKQANSVKIIKQ